MNQEYRKALALAEQVAEREPESENDIWPAAPEAYRLAKAFLQFARPEATSTDKEFPAALYDANDQRERDASRPLRPGRDASAPEPAAPSTGDTPRCDGLTSLPVQLIDAWRSLARQLERELAAARDAFNTIAKEGLKRADEADSLRSSEADYRTDPCNQPENIR